MQRLQDFQFNSQFSELRCDIHTHYLERTFKLGPFKQMCIKIEDHRDVTRTFLRLPGTLQVFEVSQPPTHRERSLETAEHEKSGPEVSYRIYLDDLDRF